MRGKCVLKDWDEQIYRALTHPIRRHIISYLLEKTFGSFTELLKCADIRDHGKLGFHLKALGNLIGNDRSRKRYHLTDRGLLAAELMARVQGRRLVLVIEGLGYEKET